MRKIIILFSIFIFSLSAYCQAGFIGGFSSEKYLLKVKGQTLKVVLSGEETFRTAFKKAVEANWTFSKYEFITQEQLLKKYHNKDDVFLLGYIQGELIDGRNDMLGVPFIGIVDRFLTNGKYRCFKDLNMYFPYPVGGIEEESLGAYLELNIRMLNKYLCLHEIQSKTITAWSYSEDIEAKNNPLCKKKKILICDLDLVTEEANITAKGKLDYEIVKRSRIAQAIINKEDVLIFYMVPSVYLCYYYLVSAKDGEIYYFDASQDTDAAHKRNQKGMFKKIGKS